MLQDTGYMLIYIKQLKNIQDTDIYIYISRYNTGHMQDIKNIRNCITGYKIQNINKSIKIKFKNVIFYSH